MYEWSPQRIAADLIRGVHEIAAERGVSPAEVWTASRYDLMQDEFYSIQSRDVRAAPRVVRQVEQIVDASLGTRRPRPARTGRSRRIRDRAGSHAPYPHAPYMPIRHAEALAEVEEARMLGRLPPPTIGRGQASRYVRCFQGRAPIVGKDAAHASCLEEATRPRGLLGRVAERFSPNEAGAAESAGQAGAMTSSHVAAELRRRLLVVSHGSPQNPPYLLHVAAGLEPGVPLAGLSDVVMLTFAMVPPGSSQLDVLNAPRSAMVSVRAPEWSEQAVTKLGPYGSRSIGHIPAARIRAEQFSGRGTRMRAKTGTPEQVIRHVVAFLLAARLSDH